MPHTQIILKIPSFLNCVSEWKNLSFELRNSESIIIFQKALLTFIRPKNSPIFNIFDPVGLKLLTRLRVNLSHLREHKFRHNFLNILKVVVSSKFIAKSKNFKIIFFEVIFVPNCLKLCMYV